ncbi:MAG TPA: peptidoglycan-associated lipoprotein Pal [Methylomirabilota bacterium]|jgi:peptidoglycan-associated lipoprotein
MSDIVSGRSRTIVLLALASVLLAGCPKGPGSGAMGGAGSPGATAGAAGQAGGAGTSTGGAGAGRSGQSAITNASTAAMGGKSGAGTTIPALPSPTEFVSAPALHDVGFDFDRYDIRPADKATLDANARWLKAHARALVLIEGHCDERGTNEYNLALGERRAKATRDYLTAAGVPDSRITVLSYGEERPVCGERTEACWAKNRRAHFLVKE